MASLMNSLTGMSPALELRAYPRERKPKLRLPKAGQARCRVSDKEKRPA
jgi:hypothetical protein